MITLIILFVCWCFLGIGWAITASFKDAWDSTWRFMVFALSTGLLIDLIVLLAGGY